MLLSALDESVRVTNENSHFKHSTDHNHRSNILDIFFFALLENVRLGVIGLRSTSGLCLGFEKYTLSMYEIIQPLRSWNR